MPDPSPIRAHPDAATFDQLWSESAERLDAFRPQDAEASARIALWEKQEYHNWLRWRICRKGFDWSKPGVIVLLAIGFGALIWYGVSTGNWFVTAGGIVAWFTCINLSFFTYFGLTLPGPPLALPKPKSPYQRCRAELGVYPAGYERRKRARVWARVPAEDGGAPLRFELALNELPPEIAVLIQLQQTWRMQRGDAPLTLAVIETQPPTRREIDDGEAPIEVIAWKWDPAALTPFDRKK